MNKTCLAVAFLFLHGSFFAQNPLPGHFAVAEIDGNTYWRHPFHSLFHPKQLEEFIIMDINRVHEKKKGAGAGARSNKVRISLFHSWFWASCSAEFMIWMCLARSDWALLDLATGRSFFWDYLDWKWDRHNENSLPGILLEKFKLCLLLGIEILTLQL